MNDRDEVGQNQIRHDLPRLAEDTVPFFVKAWYRVDHNLMFRSKNPAFR